MRSEFYPVEGPWPGKLWMAARPRGGDWLQDEMLRWHREGVEDVLSLLTPGEEHDLGIENEAEAARAVGLAFHTFPIADRDVPASESAFARAVDTLDSALKAGRTVVVHCRQGIGRSGMMAACALILHGIDPAQAIDEVSQARGVPVPETPAQREWISHYAAGLTPAK